MYSKNAENKIAIKKYQKIEYLKPIKDYLHSFCDLLHIINMPVFI